jgi:hypothetical protein
MGMSAKELSHRTRVMSAEEKFWKERRKKNAA